MKMDDETRHEKLQGVMEKANLHYRKAKRLLVRWLEHVRDCGEALLQAKRLFKKKRNNRWPEFVRRCFDGKSPETAQDYMIVARKWNHPNLVAARERGIEVISIRKFMELLSPKPTEEPTSATDNEPEEEPEPKTEEKPHTRKIEQIREDLASKVKQKINATDDREILILSYAFDDLGVWDMVFDKLKVKTRKIFELYGFNYDPYDEAISEERIKEDINKIIEIQQHPEKEKSKAVA